jgi:hypothetical protein
MDEKDDELDEPIKEEGKPPISAAELRAQKRKMKRFRYDMQASSCTTTRLTLHQVDTQPNPFSHERIHSTGASRCCSSGTTCS